MNEHDDAKVPTDPGSDRPPLASASSETLPATLATGRGLASPDAPTLARGRTVGRYVILERLGSGGMGVVYAAYDPELDRKIALKLLHAAPGPEARADLLREAQAMARLSHPNVVTVHDVGEFEGRVFAAMEFVDGSTLRSVFEEGGGRWPDLRDTFVAAARGLAAAHAAGLVHRDFKPENVLVARDGRVLVTDFGLARASGELTDGGSLAATRPGLGTPAYMPPEQMTGETLDPRADQFSFCVALYEALTGARPHRGNSVAALVVAVLERPPEPFPAQSGVPVWLRRVVLRGLSRDPADRWPDMDTLLSQLLREQSRRRQRTVAGVALVGLGLGFGVFVGRGSGSDETAILCAGGENEIENAWGPDVRDAVRTKFESAGLPFAAETAALTVSRLDAWSVAWLAAHRESCEATRVHGHQSADTMDLRMECLAERSTELEGLTSVWRETTAESLSAAVEGAGDAMRRLPPLEVCNDLPWLRSRARLPAEPEARAAAQRVRDQIARARALAHAGQQEAARELARDAAQAAKHSGVAIIRAEAAGLLATLAHDALEEAGAVQHSRDAAMWALEAGDLHTAGDAAANAARYGARDKKLNLAADLWLDIADATARSSGQARALLSAAAARGRVLREREEFEAAKAVLQAALDEHGDAVPREHRNHVGIVSDLGHVLERLGEYDAALDAFEKNLAVDERVHGPDHPSTAISLNNLGAVLYDKGLHADALAVHQRALKIRTAALGPDHPVRISSTENVGLCLMALGREDEARTAYEEALRVISPEKNPLRHADILDNMGVLDLHTGKLDEAVEHHRRARTIRAEHRGDDHYRMAFSDYNLAEVEMVREDFRSACALFDTSLSRFERVFGSDHPYVAYARTGAGTCHLELGHTERARALLERASAQRSEDSHAAPLEVATTEFGLIRLDGPRRVAEARTLIETIRDDPSWEARRLTEQIAAWVKRSE